MERAPTADEPNGLRVVFETTFGSVATERRRRGSAFVTKHEAQQFLHEGLATLRFEEVHKDILENTIDADVTEDPKYYYVEDDGKKKVYLRTKALNKKFVLKHCSPQNQGLYRLYFGTMCKNFFVCDTDRAFRFECPTDTYWSTNKTACDVAQQINCNGEAKEGTSTTNRDRSSIWKQPSSEPDLASNDFRSGERFRGGSDKFVDDYDELSQQQYDVASEEREWRQYGSREYDDERERDSVADKEHSGDRGKSLAEYADYSDIDYNLDHDRGETFPDSDPDTLRAKLERARSESHDGEGVRQFIEHDYEDMIRQITMPPNVRIHEEEVRDSVNDF